MKAKIPSNWKNCASCTHWCGKQTPDAFRQNIEYETTERAKCAGGGFNGAPMSGTSGCSKWEQRFKK